MNTKKKILWAFFFLLASSFLLPTSVFAQFTTVTATVKDSNGIPYAAGTMSAVLVPGASGGYTLNGAPYSGRVGPVTLDSTGKFVANFGDVTLITPGSPQWQITVNSNQGGIAPPLGTGAQTFTITTTGTTISGSSPVDISTTLNAAAPKLTNITLGAGTVTSVSATGPIVATPNPIVGTGTISCPTCNTSSATIAGTIAATQVAFGSGANTIAGDASFTFATGTKLLSLNGLVVTQPSAATIGFSETNTTIAGAQFTATLDNTGNYTQSYTSPTAGNSIFQQWFATAIWTVSNSNGVNAVAISMDPTLPGVNFQTGGGITLFSFNTSTGVGIFGIDNTTAGTLQLANGTSAAHTIWGSAATTTNTILGFATAPTTNHLVSCVVSGTTCTLTDSGAVAGAVALSSITAATGSHTIANGNNPQTWNWALTTDAIAAMTFGSTSAATNGTLTNGLANQSLVSISTGANSTATPFNITQGSITNTVATPLAQFQTTWNNAGLTGVGIVLNVTNTASAAGSLLANLQVGNVSQFKVDKVGNLTSLGNLSCGLAGTSSCVITGAGSTSGTATITWPAVAGTSTNPLVFSNVLETADGAVSTPAYGFSSQSTLGFYRGANDTLGISFSGSKTSIAMLGGSVAPQIRLGSNGLFQFSNTADSGGSAADTGLSRDSAGVVDVGTGAQGSKAGTLNDTNENITGVLTESGAGAASAPSVSITGTVFTGGSGTTTVPLAYINQGTAPTTWSTTGTEFGINAPSGFAGNFVDYRVNGGGSLYSVNQNGLVTASGGVNVSALRQQTNGHIFYSQTAPTVSSGFGTGASITANNGTVAFRINVGTSNTGNGVVGLPTAATGWNCYATDITTTSAAVSQTKQTASSTTSCTLQNYTDLAATGAWTDSDVLAVSAFAF